jgi:pimeloyl-ACP methyl ester carboxylesterase
MVQAIKRDEVFIEPEGIHVETHQPERRSRKPPLLLVHGALTGSWLWTEFAAFLAERGWEAHAVNLRGHFTSDMADLSETSMRDYADDVGVAMRHLGRPAVIIGWGIGALAGLMYAERNPVLGMVLLAPSPPAAALPRRPDEHELKAVPAVYDAAWWGWTGSREELRERMPDMDDQDIEKMTELLDGARESGLARRERMLGIPIDPSGLMDTPSLVIGAGMDDVIHPTEARRTADLLGAGYEYFPSATHFGLVMGEHTWPEVAQSVLGWLEERRHAMAAAALPSGRDARLPARPGLPARIDRRIGPSGV